MSSTVESGVRKNRDLSLYLDEESKSTRLERIVSELMLELGLDLNDQHFKGTPARVARLFRGLTHGYQADPVEILKTFESLHNELIVVSAGRNLRLVTERGVGDLARLKTMLWRSD